MLLGQPYAMVVSLRLAKVMHRLCHLQRRSVSLRAACCTISRSFYMCATLERFAAFIGSQSCLLYYVMILPLVLNLGEVCRSQARGEQGLGGNWEAACCYTGRKLYVGAEPKRFMLVQSPKACYVQSLVWMTIYDAECLAGKQQQCMHQLQAQKHLWRTY